ncbi:hypothetical protein [Novosphingobium sp.]|uniref:hypothetical protein n=1 Tax=Novosphingobium sp. TaxID=1874826 RepID=UPI00286A836B|nr:hypothetical protein [Novosphingobium sp.]
MRSLALVPLLAVALSGCMASRYQIANALERYGLNSNQASCASEFLRGHLTTGQVDRLARAADDYRSNDNLNFGDLIRVAASVRDGETFMQVGAAAVACKLIADIPLPV